MAVGAICVRALGVSTAGTRHTDAAAAAAVAAVLLVVPYNQIPSSVSWSRRDLDPLMKEIVELLFQSERCATPPPLHRDGTRLSRRAPLGKLRRGRRRCSSSQSFSWFVRRCTLPVSLSLSLRGYKRHANLDKSSSGRMRRKSQESNTRQGRETCCQVRWKTCAKYQVEDMC